MSDTSFLDWPFFDDRHRELGRDLADWADRKILPLAKHHPEDGKELDALAKQLVAKLGSAGWLGACVPAAYGGARETLDVRSLCLSRETLAYRLGLADFAFAMQGLGTGAITLSGSEEQKSRYLDGIAAGTRIAAFAISEPNSGSDVAAMTTTARQDGEDYVIDGIKTWISNAGIADQYVVFARTGEAPGSRGLSAFIVTADTPGLTVSERIAITAPHPLGSLKFDNCRVPATNMIGEPGKGFSIAMATLDVFRATVGAAALGFARRALDEATGRAGTRIAFGHPIAEFQLIQEKIADMAVKIDAAALLIYRAAWAKDTGAESVTREASMAKLYATEAAQEVVDAAVQIFGGSGVVTGAPVEQLYREVRALRIYEGTSEIQKLVIAGKVLK